MTVLKPSFLFYCRLIWIFCTPSKKVAEHENVWLVSWKKSPPYERICCDRESMRKRGKGAFVKPATNFVIGAIARGTWEKRAAYRCQHANCASAKVNDMVDDAALCSRKPVFVGGVTGFGEICIDIICARAFPNGEEIYYPWTTWKRITSESGLGPSNPDSSDFTAFRHERM